MYCITSIKNNQRQIISKHHDKDEAMISGARYYKKSEKDELVALIECTLDDNDNIIGKYKLLNSWFC